MNTFLLIIAFFLLGITNCLAQKPKEELMKINSAFDQKADYETKVLFETFADNNFKTPINSVQSHVIHKDKNMFYKQLNSEIIRNSKFTINIDHYNKMIIVDYTPKMENKEDKTFSFNTYLDSLFKYYSNVKVTELDKSTRELVFEFKNGNYTNCSVKYNPSTYIIKSVTYGYKEPVELKDKKKHKITYVITYEVFTKKPIVKKEFFSEKKYVLIGKNNKVSPSIGFKNYQVISKLKKV